MEIIRTKVNVHLRLYKSKDIGEYNTCVHGCEYCYANASKQAAAMNYKSHKNNLWSETITGK